MHTRRQRRGWAYGLALLVGFACGSKEGVSREEGGAGVVDLEYELFNWECRCYGPAEGVTPAECRELIEQELQGLDQFGECIDDVLAANPDLRPQFACVLDAQYDYVDCLNAQGCNLFTCQDGAQVAEEWVCDGESDCNDGSDEPDDCMPITCPDGTTIPQSWRCDGVDDCEDGSDEPDDCPMNCETTYYTAADSCGDTTELDDAMSQCYEVEGSFGCGDGTTIDISMVCDGSADCPDGEDELGCAAGRAAVHLMRLR